MKNKGIYLLKNALFFCISKGIAFLAPLLFVKFVTLEEYGEVEFAYSTGSVCAVFLMLGLGGAYPYFILKKQERHKEQYFFLYGYLIFFLSCLFACFFYSGQISQPTYFVYLFSAIFALQRLYSAILKSNDKGYIGVLYDGGYYFLLAAVMLLCYLIHSSAYIFLLRIGMEGYLGVLVLLFCYKYYRTKTGILQKQECFGILKYSWLLILSGGIVFWLTSSPRIYIKYLMGYEQVGLYSMYFRYVGISVVIYQFCYIAFFKKLYLSKSDRLDKYFALLMLIVLGACFLFYFFYPLFASYLLKDTEVVLSAKLYMLLVLQMPVWVGIALNEGIISRENAVKQMNIYLGIQVMLFPVVLFFLKEWMTLELFTFLNVLMFSMAYLSQIRILKTKSIALPKCRLYACMTMGVAVLYYFVF